MAGYKTHTAVSILLGLVFYLSAYVFSRYVSLVPQEFFSHEGLLRLFATVLFFGLFPDIDTNSVGSHFLYSLIFILLFLLILLGNYEEAAFLGLFSLIPVLSRHRGWTHSLFCAFFIPLLLTAIPVFLYGRDSLVQCMPYTLAGICAYMGHLVFDRIFF
ncbi:metal-dependent hydrolase [Chitinivibrio alkaliphilus]|uniref:Membrane-bound metal-dependent hydrolase n=1 Tax=Chitinivibrio alkaliphilus ACht1 TaxID=1313304 RepID=U7DE24_9BACT|nr:metal-dependent hydrolase [Chitinivibrio alkaliphilus]ERP39166.1 hypothetical protein CALK_0336 [Chitinivibrio alkaliphilus ACht1]